MNPQLEAQIQALRSRLNQAITTLESSNLPNSGERVELLNYTQNILGNIDNSLGLFYAEKILRLNENWPSEDFELDGDNLTQYQMDFKNTLNNTVKKIGRESKLENRKLLYNELIAPLAKKALISLPGIAKKVDQMWLESFTDNNEDPFSAVSSGSSEAQRNLNELKSIFEQGGDIHAKKEYFTKKIQLSTLHPIAHKDANIAFLGELENIKGCFEGDQNKKIYDDFLKLLGEKNEYTYENGSYTPSDKLEKALRDLQVIISLKFQDVEDYYTIIRNNIFDHADYKVEKGEGAGDFSKLSSALFKCGFESRITKAKDLFTKLASNRSSLEELAAYFGPGHEANKQAREIINGKLQEVIRFDENILNLDDKDSNSLSNWSDAIIESINDLLFIAYSSNYSSTNLSDTRSQENQVNEAIKSNLSTMFSTRFDNLLKVAIKKISEKFEDTNITEKEKSKYDDVLQKLRRMKDNIRNHIADTKDLHETNRKMLGEMTKGTGTKEDISTFFKFLEDISTTSRKQMAVLMEKYDRSDTSDNKQEDMKIPHQEISKIFYNLIHATFNANGNVIPESFLLPKSVDKGKLYGQEIELMEKFISKLGEKMNPNIQKNEGDQVRMLAWTFLSVEIMTGKLAEEIANTLPASAIQTPWVKRLLSVAILRNPRHRTQSSGTFGIHAFGNPSGINYGGEMSLLPNEIIGGLLADLDMEEKDLFDPQAKMLDQVSFMIKYALRHKQTATRLFLSSVFPQLRTAKYLGNTGAGMVSPETIKTLSTQILNYTGTQLSSDQSNSDIKGEKPNKGLLALYDFFGNILFEEALRQGRTDYILPWKEYQAHWGSPFLTHSRFTDTLSKEYNANKGQHEDTKVTYNQLREFLLQKGQTGDVFVLLKDEAQKRAGNDLIFAFITKEEVRDDLKATNGTSIESYVETTLSLFQIRNGAPFDENDQSHKGKVCEIMREVLGKDNEAFSKLILDFEAEKRFLARPISMRIHGEVKQLSYSSALQFQYEALQAEGMSGLDPGELLNTLIGKLPILAKGKIDLNELEIQGLVNNGKLVPGSASVDAFFFLFVMKEKDIKQESLISLHRKSRQELFIAFRAYAKNKDASLSDLDNRSNMIHIKKIMDFYSNISDFAKSNNFEMKSFDMHNLINDVVFDARYGNKKFLAHDGINWKIKQGITFNDCKYETISTDVNEIAKINIQNRILELLFFSNTTGRLSFFDHFYTNGPGKYAENTNEDNFWYRAGKIANWGAGFNQIVPRGYSDTLSRVKYSKDDTFGKIKGQSELFIEAELKLHEAESKIGSIIKKAADDSFFSELVTVHTEIHDKLRHHYSYADRDRFQIDLFRLSMRLVGENPKLIGVSGLIEQFNIHDQSSIVSGKKPIYGTEGYAVENKFITKYAAALRNSKVITERGFFVCLVSLQKYFDYQAFQENIPKIFLVGGLGVGLGLIGKAIYDAADDTGIKDQVEGTGGAKK